MRLYQCLLTKNDCYRAGRQITPRGIMLHSTGSNNPNLRRYVQPDDGRLGRNTGGNDWNRGGIGACVHAFIGKLADGSVATYQTLPWTQRAWHAGTGRSGKSANNTHISFEICEDGLSDGAYFAAVYREAVELCAYLCKAYKLRETDILCHAEGFKQGIASNHADVLHWFPRHGKSMDTFRADVAERMRGEEDMTTEEVRTIAREEVLAQSMVYRKVEDVPLWGKPTVEKLIAKGAVQGDGLGIDLSYEQLRLLVINDRMGVYGGDGGAT